MVFKKYLFIVVTLFCALIWGSLLFFTGCGGGAGLSGLPDSSVSYTITGRISNGSTLPSIAPSIYTAAYFSGCEVFLESRPDVKTLSDTSGQFILTQVPAGTHRVIARYQQSDKTYRARSLVLSATGEAKDLNAGDLLMGLAVNRIRGILKDSQGNPLAYIPMTLWGETFYSNSQGIFETPLMPANSEGVLSILSPYFNPQEIDLEFSSPNSPFIETVLVTPGQANHPPKVRVVPDSFSIQAGMTLSLKAYAQDPDGDQLNYAWSASNGILSTGSNPLFANWTAPAHGTIATVSVSVQDPGGLTSKYSLGLSILGGEPDTTPPLVIGRYPLPDAVGIPLNAVVSVTFNEAIDASTLDGGSFFIRQADILVSGTISIGENNTLGVFTPASNLVSNSTYTVFLFQSVKDASGNAIIASDSWQFTTVNTADVTPPTVISTIPASGSSDVAINTTLTITFSEPMDITSLNSTNITLSSGSTHITGALNMSNDRTIAIFTPQNQLSGLSLYTVEVQTGVKDVAGNALVENSKFSFTTASSSDVTPPGVASVTPTENATDIATSSAIAITFSEPMNVSTLNASNLTLASGATIIPGSISTSLDGRIATFTPAGPLAHATSYTMFVTSGVQDAAGNGLPIIKVWNFSTLTTPDTSPPAVTAVLPAPAGVDVASNTAVTFFFSKPMNQATLNTTNILLASGSTMVGGSVQTSSDGKIATFTPSSPLSYTSIYSTTVTTGAKDLAGNSIGSNFSSTFTTMSVPDATPPAIITFVPAENASGIGTNTAITIMFNEPMNADTLNTSNLTLAKGATIIAGSVSVSADKRTATFTPAMPLDFATTYTMFATSGMRDASGNALNSYKAWNFSTIENVAPTVVSVSPASGAVSIVTNTFITFTFSEPLDTTTLTTANIKLASGSTPVAGSVSFSGDGRIATFTPNTLLSFASIYSATVGIGVKDIAGNRLAATFSYTFSTATEPDTLAPTVTAVTPASSSTNVDTTSLVTFKFSESINAATLNMANITLASGAMLVAGNFSVSADGKVATFTPNAPLPYDSIISVTLTTGVKDTSGNPVTSNVTYSFRTTFVPDTVSPTVISVVPASAAVGIATNTSITFTFSEPMDPLSITGTTITLASGAVPVAGAVSLSGGGRIAAFTPSAALASFSTYTTSVTTGAKDIAGNIIASAFSCQFTTATAPDLIAPSVVSVIPAESAANIAVNSKVTITFSEPMKESTLTGSNLSLASGSEIIAGSISISADKRIATFTPSSALANGTTYTMFATTGLQDPSGNSLASYKAWNFSTIESVAPTVASVSPASGATKIATGTAVNITFSEAMDPTSLTTANIKLASGATPISGSISTITPDNRTVTFTPSSPLQYMNSYTASVLTGAKDTAGNMLSAPFNWTFSTTEATPPTILSVLPTESTTNLAINSVLTIIFSEPMNPSTLNSSNLILSNGTSVVPGVITMSADNRIATFTPGSPLNFSTTYTMFVGTTVQDVYGNGLTQSKVWNFRTGSNPPDSTPPTLTGIAPASATIGILTTSTIRVSFSEAIEVSTLSTTTFKLASGTTPIAGTVTLSANGFTGTFTPSSALATSSVYTITLTTQIMDLSGNTLVATYTHNFTTTSGMAEWTVMVYVDGDNQYEDKLLEDIREMGSANGLSGPGNPIRVLAQMDRHPAYDASYDNWATCKRFDVFTGMLPYTVDQYSDIGEVDMGSISTIQNFILWAKTYAPAKKYALILRNITDSDASSDLTNGSTILTAEEILTALNNEAFSVDLIGFDGSRMGSLENAYQLRTRAQVMVATQKWQSLQGWQYTGILNDLIANPTMSASQFGQKIFDRSDGGSVPIAVIDLSKITAFATALSAFSDTVIAANLTFSQWVDIIGASKLVAGNFTYEYARDIKGFLTECASASTNVNIKNSAQSALTSFNAGVIIQNYSSAADKANGLSIYLPGPNSTVDVGYTAPSILLCETHWDELVNAFNNLPNPTNAYEANNSTATAPLISLGNIYAAIGTVGDRDYYKITLATTTILTLETFGATGDYDTELYIYNSTGLTQLYYDDDSSIGVYSRLSVTLAAGTYFVRVNQYDDEDVIPFYGLRITSP